MTPSRHARILDIADLVANLQRDVAEICLEEHCAADFSRNAGTELQAVRRGLEAAVTTLRSIKP